MNLVNADVTDYRRYATSYQNERYVPLNVSDSEWSEYESVVSRVQLEVNNVASTLEQILEDIRIRQLPSVTDSITYTGSAFATTENYNSDVVPAGEVWLVESIMGMVESGPCNAIRFMALLDGNYVTLDEISNPVVGTRYQYRSQFYGIEDDRIRVQFRGCTVGVTDINVEYAVAIYYTS
jgi:hypothetical protein